MGTLSETMDQAKVGREAMTRARLDEQGMRDQAKSNIQQRRAFGAGQEEGQAQGQEQAMMMALNSMRGPEMMQQEADAMPGLGMGSGTAEGMQQLDDVRADEALTNEAMMTLQKVQEARANGAQENEIQQFKQQVDSRVQQRIQEILQQQQAEQSQVQDNNNTGSGITAGANALAREAMMPQQQGQQ